jgi:hypothetical protein
MVRHARMAASNFPAAEVTGAPGHPGALPAPGFDHQIGGHDRVRWPRRLSTIAV